MTTVEFRCRTCRTLLAVKSLADLPDPVIVPPCPKHSGHVTFAQMLRIRRSGRPTSVIVHKVLKADDVRREVGHARGTPVVLV